MAAFNLTAELNLRGPSNLSQVIGDIRRELSSVRLDLTIDPRASRNIQTITSNVNNLSSALRNAQSNAAALNTALSNLGSGISGANSGLNNLNNNLNNTNNAMRNAGNGSREAASQMEAFGRQAGLAVRRFAAFSVVTGTVYAFSRALSSAYSEFMNFNEGFVKLQQVTGGNASSLKSLVQEITRLSQTFGVSSKSILDVSKTLAQAGLSASDTQKALEALAKSALAPSFDSLNDTVEGSIALMKQFGISAGDLESALGSINSVAAKFAVEAGDIIAAIQRTGGVFAAASKGVSEGKDALNEFIAVFTSVRATTRESAETIATGLRTIFTRIQRGGTIEALKQYGVSLTDVEGKFVGAYEAVRRLSDGLKKLDPRDVRFSKIVEELGGFRQIGKVLPLIQEFATAQQALNVAQRGAGSLTTDAAKAQEALAVRITKVREEFIGLVRDIGQSKGFQNFVDISLKLASALISVADAAKNVLPAITAIAAIRGISNISGFVRGFSSSARGLPAGNNRRGYARGGFVPGSGDSDTIPAMLTPGEFVIRKKAVQAIGVDRLQKMNRYASGGIVQRFAKGGKIEDKIKKNMISNKIYEFGLVGLRSGTGKPILKKEKLVPDVSVGKPPNTKEYPVNLYKATISDIAKQGQEKTIERDISTSFAQMVEKTAATLRGVLGGSRASSNKKQQILKGSPLTSVIGTVFESALGFLGAPYMDKSEKTKSMDFPLGLGNVASKFGIPPNIPTDATRTIGGSGKGTSQMRGQIARFISAVEGGEFTKSFAKFKENKLLERSKGSKSSATIGTFRARVEAALKDTSLIRALSASDIQSLASSLQVQKLKLKRQALFGSGDDSLSGVLTKMGVDPETAFQKIYAKLPIELKKKSFAARRAQGGGISGQDTVPALLTPGEFVINKRAAQKLGSHTLHKLNRADKIQGFNSGGFVTDGIQRLNSGGYSFAQRRRMVQNRRNMRAAGDVAMDPMSLIFGAGLIGDTFSRMGAPALGAGVAAGAGTFGVGMELAKVAGLGTGIGAFASGIAAASSALSEYVNTIRQSIVETNQKKIEESSTRLDRALANLASGTVPVKESFAAINNELSIMRQALSSTEEITKLQYTPNSSLAPLRLQNITSATTNFLANTIPTGLQGLNPFAYFPDRMRPSMFDIPTGGYNFGFGQISDISRNKLGSDLSSTAMPIAERTVGILRESMKREGLSLNDAISRQARGDPKEEANIRRLIAIERMGTQYTGVEARIEQLRNQRFAPGDSTGRAARDISLKQAEQKREELVKQGVAALQLEEDKRKQVNMSIRQNVDTMDAFIQSLRQLEANISRASAQTEASFKRDEMKIGYKIGRQVDVERVDRFNENIFSNVTAYTPEEIRTATSRLGSGLGFSNEQTQSLGGNIVAFRDLKTELPKIFRQIALDQKTPGKESDPIRLLREKLTPILEKAVGKDRVSEVLSRLESQISASQAGDSGVNYQQLSENSAELSKLLEFLGTSAEFASNSMKALNDANDRLVDRMNTYVGALQRAIEFEDRAASIRMESAIQLKEALGQPVSLAERNAPIDASLNRLTSVFMPNGTTAAGTTDPSIIRARLDEVNIAKQKLEEKKNLQGDKFKEADGEALANLTLSAKQLDSALNKLATDSSKASNALRKIQEIRQVQQARQGAVLDIFSNMFDVEAMATMENQLRSYSAVMSGGPVPAFAVQEGAKGLRIAQQTMSSEDAQKAQRDYLEKATRSLVATGDMRPDMARALAQFAINQPRDLTDSITEFNSAASKMAKANEELASLSRSGAEEAANMIKLAANEFRTIVNASGVDFSNSVRGNPTGAPIVPTVERANGGLIYASQGKYVNFQPRGTDTVPAMLTPGEFVINAKAAKKNMALLRSINNGSKGYSKGGVVYLQDGGAVGSFSTSVDNQIAQLLAQLAAFDQQTENLVGSLNSLSGGKTDPQLDRKISLLRQDRAREKQPLLNQLQQLQSQQMYERNRYISETGYSGAFEMNAPQWEQRWNNMSQFDRSAYKNKEDYIEKQKEWMKQSQGSEEELKARSAEFARQYEIQQNQEMQQQQQRQQRQQQTEANKTPQQRYRDARQEELDRRREAYLTEKYRRREAYIQSRGGSVPGFSPERFLRRAAQEEKMLQQASEWWLSTGRWQAEGYSGDRFVPADVVKRFQRSDAYRSRVSSEYRLPSREQAKKAAEENAIRVQQSDSRQRVNRNIFDSFVLGEDLEIDTNGDGILETFPAGTAYRNLHPAAINADLRRTGSRPLGYDSLNSKTAERASAAINDFYTRYKTPAQKAVIERIEQKREESKRARDKYNADIGAITDRQVRGESAYLARMAESDRARQEYDSARDAANREARMRKYGEEQVARSKREQAQTARDTIDSNNYERDRLAGTVIRNQLEAGTYDLLDEREREQIIRDDVSRTVAQIESPAARRAATDDLRRKLMENIVSINGDIESTRSSTRNTMASRTGFRALSGLLGGEDVNDARIGMLSDGRANIQGLLSQLNTIPSDDELIRDFSADLDGDGSVSSRERNAALVERNNRIQRAAQRAMSSLGNSSSRDLMQRSTANTMVGINLARDAVLDVATSLLPGLGFAGAAGRTVGRKVLSSALRGAVGGAASGGITGFARSLEQNVELPYLETGNRTSFGQQRYDASASLTASNFITDSIGALLTGGDISQAYNPSGRTILEKERTDRELLNQGMRDNSPEETARNILGDTAKGTGMGAVFGGAFGGAASGFGSAFGGVGRKLSSITPNISSGIGRFIKPIGNFFEKARAVSDPRNWWDMQTRNITNQYATTPDGMTAAALRNIGARRQALANQPPMTTPIDFTTLPPGSSGVSPTSALIPSQQQQPQSLFGRLFGFGEKNTARKRKGLITAMEKTRGSIAEWSTPASGFFDIRGGLRRIFAPFALGRLNSRLGSQRRKLQRLQGNLPFSMPENAPGSSGYNRGGRSTMNLTEDNPRIQAAANEYIEQLRQQGLSSRSIQQSDISGYKSPFEELALPQTAETRTRQQLRATERTLRKRRRFASFPTRKKGAGSAATEKAVIDAGEPQITPPPSAEKPPTDDFLPRDFPDDEVSADVVIFPDAEPQLPRTPTPQPVPGTPRVSSVEKLPFWKRLLGFGNRSSGRSTMDPTKMVDISNPQSLAQAQDDIAKRLVEVTGISPEGVAKLREGMEPDVVVTGKQNIDRFEGGKIQRSSGQGSSPYGFGIYRVRDPASKFGFFRALLSGKKERSVGSIAHEGIHMLTSPSPIKGDKRVVMSDTIASPNITDSPQSASLRQDALDFFNSGQYEQMRSLTGKQMYTTREMKKMTEENRITEIFAELGRGAMFPGFENNPAARNLLKKFLITAGYKAKGGLIYASKGTLVPYQPRGTDTVPAMLTPGEFVINKKSAKQHMGLLKAINNGQTVSAKRFNKGGIVNTQYYQDAGNVAKPTTTSGGVSSIGIDTSSLDASFSNFQKYVAEFAGSMISFVDGIGSVGNLAIALQGLGSLNLSGPADSLRNASISLKGGLESLEKAIGPFSSAASNLANAINNIPPKIELTIGGTIPVVGNITVVLQGEGLDGNTTTSDQTQQITEAVTNVISTKIRDATSGRLNIT